MYESPKQITVLGSTGSVGVSTLDVIARHPERYQLHALSGHGQIDKLVAQCAQHRPRHAVLAEAARLPELVQKLTSA